MEQLFDGLFEGFAEAAHAAPFMRELLVFLAAAIIVVPVVRRLNASPIIGFLIVGAAVGPFGFGVVDDTEGVRRIAELGIVFLLFTIGLELSIDRLTSMARLVFGLGGAQVATGAALIGAIAYASGNSLEASIILGACLALSSTAMVMQLIVERGELSSVHGRGALAILLFQDLAVVPILLLVSIFAGAGDGGAASAVATALFKAAIAVTVIVFVGRRVMRPLFRIAAGAGSRELSLAMTLLAVLATSLATEAAGLSMALGAFLAGLLLSETEFRHQVEADIQPFKGLLLALFFIAVGMSISPGIFLEAPFWIISSILGLMILKAVLITVLALAFGKKLPDAIRIGVLLAQGGEFAFVVIASATPAGVLTEAAAQFMLFVVAGSMALTPFLPALAEWIAGKVHKDEDEEAVASVETLAEQCAELEGHVIIAGFGRVGRAVAEVLRHEKAAIVALDLDARRVRQMRQQDSSVFFGDASRLDILRQARADAAQALVVTLHTKASGLRAVKAARDAWPELKIFARCHSREDAAEYYAAGANLVIPEAFESSMELAGRLLEALGYPLPAAEQIIEQFRQKVYDQTLAGEK